MFDAQIVEGFPENKNQKELTLESQESAMGQVWLPLSQTYRYSQQSSTYPRRVALTLYKLYQSTVTILLNLKFRLLAALFGF